MTKPKVYLCGGINGLNDADARGWRERAKVLLVGCDTLDPMRRDYRGVALDGNIVREIVDGDLADIDACDAVLANCIRPSWGTAMEIRYAAEVGKSVFAFGPPDASPWLVYHCQTMCRSLEWACEMVVAAMAERMTRAQHRGGRGEA
jgi:nucleoside 2-deoxyribosyltransferase